MPTFGDRVAVGFSRAVTRRSVLKRSMVAIAATGAAVAAPLRFGERRASAAGTCAHHQNRLGTTCAGTSCSSNRCTSDGGCDLDSTRKRCDTWDVAGGERQLLLVLVGRLLHRGCLRLVPLL